MRIAINGMGRIGRLLFRRLVNDPSFTLVAVNDVMDTENLVYLLKYDSLFGKFEHDLSLQNDSILTSGKSVKVLQQDHPSKISWKELNVDIVLECSGKFTSKTGAEEHLKAGTRKVLLSTTGSTDIPLMIYGFNHHQLNESVNIVSPGGCMTNCAAHVLYILNSIGIESAQINILHSYTSRQQLVDT